MNELQKLAIQNIKLDLQKIQDVAMLQPPNYATSQTLELTILIWRSLNLMERDEK